MKVLIIIAPRGKGEKPVNNFNYLHYWFIKVKVMRFHQDSPWLRNHGDSNDITNSIVTHFYIELSSSCSHERLIIDQIGKSLRIYILRS
jgi:hypothetical protein